jgi:hypothetical protein
VCHIFRVKSLHFHVGVEENHAQPQNSRSPGQDSNPAFTRHKSEAIATRVNLLGRATYVILYVLFSELSDTMGGMHNEVISSDKIKIRKTFVEDNII